MKLKHFISILLSSGRPGPVRAVSSRIGCCVSAAYTLLALTAPAFLLMHSCSVESPEVETTPYYNIYVEGEGKMSSMDLFFFDTTPVQRLDSYLRLGSLEGNRIVANSLNRPSRVVLLSNVPGGRYDWSSIDSYASLSQRSFILDNELLSAPQLSGEATLEAGWSRACVLSLKTSLTRVRLHQISFDFSGRQYASSTAGDIKVYLTRACTECLPLQGDKGISWMNSGGADSVTLSRLSHPEYLFSEIGESVGARPLECNLDFYTYPNRNDGFGETRLVIECVIQGRKFYYPLSLPPLVRSTAYDLDVCITRLGSSDPDTPAKTGAAEVAIRVLPWENASEQTVTF